MRKFRGRAFALALCVIAAATRAALLATGHVSPVTKIVPEPALAWFGLAAVLACFLPSRMSAMLAVLTAMAGMALGLAEGILLQSAVFLGTLDGVAFALQLAVPASAIQVGAAAIVIACCAQTEA